MNGQICRIIYNHMMVASLRQSLLTCAALLFFFHMLSAQNNSTESSPIIIGKAFQLPSKILAEKRTVNVYLPDSYHQRDTVRYPVIYVLDGGIDEDFFHITGIVRYDTEPWINRFPQSIVVGIENTDRLNDFTFPVSDLNFVEKLGYQKDQFPHYGNSAKYIAFIENELQPFINSRYKTTRPYTVIGESLAGLLATEVLMKHRTLFDHYIIVSPSLWWGDESLLKEAPQLLKAETGDSTTVYIGAANQQEDTMMYHDAIALHKALELNGGNKMKVYYEYLPDELHSTIFHQAVYNAFKAFYPKTEYGK